QFHAAAGRAGRGRGAPAIRPPLLQRCGARLRQRLAARSRRGGGAHLRLPRRRIFPGRRGRPGAGRGGVRTMKAAAWLRRVALPSLLLVATLATPLQAQERILAYDSKVVVAVDGSLDVTERIKVRAEGSQIRRGIYRDFPT